jgi:hypothetical protein
MLQFVHVLAAIKQVKGQSYACDLVISTAINSYTTNLHHRACFSPHVRLNMQVSKHQGFESSQI